MVTRCLLAFAFSAICIYGEISDQTRLAVEAILRLDGGSLAQNPKLKETVDKLLARTEGSPEFIRLVQHFKIPRQESGLFEAALRNPQSEAGIAAAKELIGGGSTNLFVQALTSADVNRATNCVQVLANTKAREANVLILSLFSRPHNPITGREAVRGLAQSQDGAKAILQLAKEGTLPENLKFTASTELHRVPWPDIRSQAQIILPLPAGSNAQPLPHISEMVKMQGDPAKGERIFNSPTAGCATCHQVKGQGIDFGPNLTEIGDKLAKEALYESILDPSAGISFGYEAWQIELKSGDELYGLIASETSDELSIKGVGGIVTKCKISEIARRTRSPLSIMPAGLQQTLSAQDLADLIEFLLSLKKS